MRGISKQRVEEDLEGEEEVDDLSTFHVSRHFYGLVLRTRHYFMTFL